MDCNPRCRSDQGYSNKNSHYPIANFQSAHEVPCLVGLFRLHRIAGHFTIHRWTEAKIQHLKHRLQHEVEAHQSVSLNADKLNIQWNTKGLDKHRPGRTG